MFMGKLTVGALLAAVVFGLPGTANGDTATFKLQYVKPSQMLKAIQREDNKGLMVKGIDTITARDAKQLLLVSGTPDSLKDMRDIVSLLDIPPRIIQLKIALVRFHFRGDSPSDWDVETVAEAVVSAANNMSATVTLDTADEADTLMIRPRLNADKTITLLGELNLKRRIDSKMSRKVTIDQRKVTPGRKTTIAGTTDSTRADVQRTVSTGQLSANQGEHTAYYMQVTPILLEQSVDEQ